MSPKKSEAAARYEAQCNHDLEQAKNMFATLAGSTGERTLATVLSPLNDLWIVLDRGMNDAALLRNVSPDADVRAVADRCEQDFSKIATDIGMSRPIYDAVTALDTKKEDVITQRYVKNVLRDFRRAGVDKDPDTRERIKKLREELVLIGQAFSKNVNEDVRKVTLDSTAELEGLPADYVEAHKPGADGKVTITTDYPDYVPFMTYAKSDAKKKALYVEFRKRGHPANDKVLSDLLAKRYELARLLGYKNWAEYITEDKMIKTSGAARDFIEKVNRLAQPRVKRDYDELLARLQKDEPKAISVGDWQKSYLEELVKKEKYTFDSQALREYFPYDRVKQGVLDTMSSMFGVQFVRIEVPVWHQSVEAYEMKAGASVLGRFYLDMHPRENKYKHAAAFPMRTGVKGVQVPEAALVCNFPGGDGTPGLMEHDHVETFFHEFGHLIHHLFGGGHRWLGVSGFNTEWDFVEAPSQLLEEWAWSADALRKFAINTKGEALPPAMIEKMRAARDFGKGLWVKHQMFYAAVSLNYYDRDPAGLDTTKLMKELQQTYSPFAYVDDTYFQYSFGHLDGYSAIYYTYMWSLAIAKDLFSVFQKKGMFDLETAARYRTFILEQGGSKDADLMVREFLGRAYTFDSFASWLNAGTKSQGATR